MVNNIQASGNSPKPDIHDVAPAWQPAETLTALQQLIDLAGTAPAAVARRAGLSTSELHALRHLADQPMGPAALARTLGVTTAASSGVVDRLVAHGHAERVPHAGDGRRTEVHITDTGRAEVLGHLGPMFRSLAELEATMTAEERSAVERYLAGAVAALRTIL